MDDTAGGLTLLLLFVDCSWPLLLPLEGATELGVPPTAAADTVPTGTAMPITTPGVAVAARVVMA